MEGHSTIRNAANAPVRDRQRSASEVTALDRGIRVLEMVVDAGEDVALGAIAKRTQLPRSTVHRLLQTLVAHGLLEPSGGGLYRIGPKLLALAGRVVETVDYSSLIGATLRDLQSQTLETIHFGILNGLGGVYVAKLPGRRPYQMVSRVGDPIALHSSSIGKAILAFLPADERAQLISQLDLVRKAANTITSRRELEADLEAARARGWTLDNEENEDGIRCIGSPVFNHASRVVGAISVSAPVFDFTVEAAINFAPTLRAAAQRASYALGATPELFTSMTAATP
jgi:IclR family acetate operon transcriptional repressor